MRKLITFIVLTLISSSCMFGQVRLIEEAEALFRAREYHSATALYEVLSAQKNPEMWIYRLGQCAFYNKDYVQAEMYFQQLNAWNEKPSAYYLEYGKSMMMQGKYEDARETFVQYQTLEPSDKQIGNLIKSCDYGKQHQTENPDVSFNQPNLDIEGLLFGIALYKDGIVFSNPNYVTDENTGASFPQYRFQYSKRNAEGFDRPQAFAGELKTKYFLGGPSFTADYNQFFFSMNDSELRFSSKKKFEKGEISSTGINTLNIFKTEFQQGAWTTPVPLGFNDREFSCTHPSISKDGKKLVFASNQSSGAGGYDIYLSEFRSGTWTNPMSLGTSVNSAGNELYPFIWNDTILYFSSDGHVGFGGADLFVSYFRQGKWSEPTNLGWGFNSFKDDFGFIMEYTGHGYFASNRYTKPGKDELFSFTKIIHYQKGNGKVTDELTLRSIANAEVLIYVGDSLVTTLLTDAQGRYQFDQFNPDQVYNLVFRKPGYKDAEIILDPRKDKLEDILVKMEPIVEKDVVFVFNDILFEFAKWDLLQESKEILDRLGDLLIKNPKAKVELSAHTDSRGSDKANLELSQKRANSAVEYLISKGVLPEQLVAKGYGESMLKNNCGNKAECSEEEHAVNRRVEIKVLDVKQ